MSAAAAPAQKAKVCGYRGGEWIAQVRDLQLSRLAPEEREQMRARAERQRAQVAMHQQAHEMRKRCAKTKCGMKKAMRAMEECDRAAPAMAPAAAGAAYGSIVRGAQQAYAHAEAMDECADPADAGEYGLVDAPRLALLSRDEAARAEDEAVEHEESADAVREFQALLESFRREPAGDEALAAKFKLYEDYLATVERLRADVLKLWGDSRGQLPEGAVRAGVERQIRGIDDERNTGLPDFAPGRWFVYDMARKAEGNNQMLSGIMRSIEAKLRLLSEQEEAECPFCLEAMDGEHPATVLGCCHRVGTSCWAEWRAFRGARACCPLCRHQDFIDGLATQ